MPNRHEDVRSAADAASNSINNLLDTIGLAANDQFYDAAAHLLGYLARIGRDI